MVDEVSGQLVDSVDDGESISDEHLVLIGIHRAGDPQPDDLFVAKVSRFRSLMQQGVVLLTSPRILPAPTGLAADAGKGFVLNDDGTAYVFSSTVGDVITAIYRVGTSAPGNPSGGSWDGTTYTPPSGWVQDPPSVPTGSKLYVSLVKLDGDGSTVSYSPIITFTGDPGTPGLSTHLIFRRNDSEPPAPSASEFVAANGVISSYPASWSAGFPSLGDTLWGAVVSVSGSVVTVGAVTRMFAMASGITQESADTRYVNVSGDSMTGKLTVTASGDNSAIEARATAATGVAVADLHTAATGNQRALSATRNNQSQPFATIAGGLSAANDKSGMAFGSGAAPPDTEFYRQSAGLIRSPGAIRANEFLVDLGLEQVTRENLGIFDAGTKIVGVSEGNLVELDADGQFPDSVLPGIGLRYRGPHSSSATYLESDVASTGGSTKDLWMVVNPVNANANLPSFSMLASVSGWAPISPYAVFRGDAPSASIFYRGGDVARTDGSLYYNTVAGNYGAASIASSDDWVNISSGGTPGNVNNASTTTRGIIRIATQAEANAGTVTDRAITPETLQGVVDDIVTDTALDSTTPANESTSVAPSRQSVAEALSTIGVGAGDGALGTQAVFVNLNTNSDIDLTSGWIGTVSRFDADDLLINETGWVRGTTGGNNYVTVPANHAGVYLMSATVNYDDPTTGAGRTAVTLRSRVVRGGAAIANPLIGGSYARGISPDIDHYTSQFTGFLELEAGDQVSLEITAYETANNYSIDAGSFFGLARFGGPAGATGTQGDIGTPGTAGTNGWSPVPAAVEDGERRVIQIVDWTGGTGTKPAVDQYISTSGLTSTLADATDFRGAAGEAAMVVGGGAGGFETEEVGSVNINVTQARRFVGSGIIAPESDDNPWLLVNFGRTSNFDYEDAPWLIISTERLRARTSTAGTERSNTNSMEIHGGITSAFLNIQFYLSTVATTGEILLATDNASQDSNPFSVHKFVTPLSTSAQQAVVAGNNTYNHILFRRSPTKPASPSVVYTSAGYDPEITSDSDWQLGDPDPLSSDSIWVAYASSSYDADGDVWSITSWTVLKGDDGDGFEVQYSHGTDPSNLVFHDPPVHASSHSTPDNFMRALLASGQWSPPVRIRDRTNIHEWTTIFDDSYIGVDSTSKVVTHDFTDIDLDGFSELLVKVQIFTAWSPNVDANTEGIIESIFTKELAGGQWGLSPYTNSNSESYDSANTYRIVANRGAGVSVSRFNDTSPEGDNYGNQVTFFMKLQQPATANGRVASRVRLFGFALTYNRALVSLYGR